ASPDVDAAVTRSQTVPIQRSPKAGVTVISGRTVHTQPERLSAAPAGLGKRHPLERESFGLKRCEIGAEQIFGGNRPCAQWGRILGWVARLLRPSPVKWHVPDRMLHQ